MPMDERKQRIMMAIVTLYSAAGEPVGSNLLSRHFGMAVSSATLRNEMAALTRLGLLEQPHTSAGRIPTSKGYRYYVDHILDVHPLLPRQDGEKLEGLFRTLDYDPERLVQSAARAFADMLGCAVLATTPRARDMAIAHFKVIQVGRYTAAVLAVTEAGGVRTRVAKVEREWLPGDAEKAEQALNRHLCFVVDADADAALVRSMMDGMADASNMWPVVSAALTLLSEVGKPNVYMEGHQYLLQWPELDGSLKSLLELMDDAETTEALIQPVPGRTTIQFGDEMPKPIPGACFVTRQYVAGGGRLGIISVVGPARMRYREVIPLLEYFSNLLGQGISGNLAG